MISRIMNRLHRVFNKDPQPYHVLFISSAVGGTLDIDETGIIITHQHGTSNIAFGNKTLDELQVEINAQAYLSATLSHPDYSQLLAKGLLPTVHQDLSDGSVYMSDSIFYNEMQVYAGLLQQQADMMEAGIKQLYLHSAYGDWLDYWGKDCFGIMRNEDEHNNDSAYLSRIISTILKPTQNNKAMEQAIIGAANISDCAVLDTIAGAESTLKYNGSALYAGEHQYIHEYGSQPGRFYISVDLPTEDGRTLDSITKTLVATANAIKAAGTKLDGVQYKTSTSDTVKITESATLTATDVQADTMPWGIRYDGSMAYNSGRALAYDGADTYDGATPYSYSVGGDVLHNNSWESDRIGAATVQSDINTAVVLFDGLASYDGVFDQGATPEPFYDGRMTVTTKRNYLFNGVRAYGSGKEYDGSKSYGGAINFAPSIEYKGIHTIQEVTI